MLLILFLVFSRINLIRKRMYEERNLKAGSFTSSNLIGIWTALNIHLVFYTLLGVFNVHYVIRELIKNGI